MAVCAYRNQILFRINFMNTITFRYRHDMMNLNISFAYCSINCFEIHATYLTYCTIYCDAFIPCSLIALIMSVSSKLSSTFFKRFLQIRLNIRIKAPIFPFASIRGYMK